MGQKMTIPSPDSIEKAALAAFFASDWNKMRKNEIKNYKTEKLVVIRCGRGILKLEN